MSIFRAVKSDPPYYQEVVLYYKINPCSSLSILKAIKAKGKNICTEQNCFNYHNDQERRREVFHETTHELVYEPVLCESLFTLGKCMDEEKCRYCHTENEMVYHPLYYKTQLCKGCQFDNMTKLCPLYHADEVNRSLMLERLTTKKGKENSNASQNGDASMSRNFMLETFKTKPCTSKGNHNPKVCAFYHSEQDRRRAPYIYSYSTILCSLVARKRMCPHGDDCKFSHSMVEQLYHPDRYKKKFCQNHPHNIHKCKYGNYCSFAHSETEIKIKLLHNLKKDEQFYQALYKTVFCPYMSEHDRNQCVYAHNPQDYRRDPSQYSYNPIQCPDWSQGQIFTYDEGKCPRGMDCGFCHGWKELDYHPLCYKTKSCNNVKVCKKMDCPFLHGDRQSQEDLQEKFFNKIGFKEVSKAKDKIESSIIKSDNEPKFYFENQFQNQTNGLTAFQYKKTNRTEIGDGPNAFFKLNQGGVDRQNHHSDLPKKQENQEKKFSARHQNYKPDFQGLNFDDKRSFS